MLFPVARLSVGGGTNHREPYQGSVPRALRPFADGPGFSSSSAGRPAAAKLESRASVASPLPASSGAATTAATGKIITTTASTHAAKKAADKAIREIIKEEDVALLARHPWLKPNRDAIGWAIVAISILGHFATAAAYFCGWLHWSAAVVLSTLLLSSLHEIEHDIFHGIYFGRPGKPKHEFVMLLIHLFKLHVSPWWRMKWHIKHHAASGTDLDVEERLLGLGMPLGLPRLLVTVSPIFYALASPSVAKDNPDFAWQEPVTQSKWQMSINLLSGVVPIAYLAGVDLVADAGLGPNAIALLETLFVCCLVATHVRHICITVVTTMVHYYEDITPGIVHEQCQILEPWWLVPFQAGCWNFGATHWIHHFVPRQPFWERTLCAPTVNRRVRDLEAKEERRRAAAAAAAAATAAAAAAVQGTGIKKADLPSSGGGNNAAKSSDAAMMAGAAMRYNDLTILGRANRRAA
eukprot:g1629.t1